MTSTEGPHPPNSTTVANNKVTTATFWDQMIKYPSKTMRWLWPRPVTPLGVEGEDHMKNIRVTCLVYREVLPAVRSAEMGIGGIGQGLEGAGEL